MTTHAEAGRAGLFFVVGPLRTGSSLMARCLDDHPEAICLCESEINRVLFREYAVVVHCWRMLAHGLSLDEVVGLLDLKKQDEIDSLLRWYTEVAPKLSERYGKPVIRLLGDKSPDFFRSPELVHYLASNHPLIYTVRDPHAILWSIESQADASPQEKAERWDSLARNYVAWKPHLDAANLLAVKYEDVVTDPTTTMQSVYAFLGLPPSWMFLSGFERRFPARFLWTTAVDWTTGNRKDFDPSRILSWKTNLTDAQRARVADNPDVVEFMDRFGYEH